MAAKAHYACLALLLLLGIQLATCKSVDETFKDDHYNTRTLSFNKPRVDEDSNEEEVTSLSSEETSESDTEEDTTPILVTSSSKPLKNRKPTTRKPTTTTTTESNDDESMTNFSEDNEEVQEGEDDEVAPTVKPLINNKPKPKNQKKVKPATALPAILDRINSEEETPSTDEPHLPKQPALNLLPPMPNNYYPQNFNSFMTQAAQNPTFSPWGFNPMYASPPTAYDYPRPTGPAFSDSKAGKGSDSVAVGSGFASASASASGSGGTVSTSTSPGNGYLHTSNSFGSQSNSVPARGSHQNPGSFVNVRGSFPASDGESVAIEVNGPVSSGAPAYESNYASSGPSYAASGSYAPVPYAGMGQNYGGYINPADLQAFFQQYFQALQAQQQSFQQQLQAQIDAQRQAIWEQSNQVDSNFGAYGGSHSNVPQSAYAGASLGPNGGFQTGHISPAAPGIFSRFGEEIPPPSGKQFGVFSSSSSSSSTGPDGKQISHKSATVGINDNGKVSYKTVHDP